jgi:hypothetical protein
MKHDGKIIGKLENEGFNEKIIHSMAASHVWLPEGSGASTEKWQLEACAPEEIAVLVCFSMV